MRRSTAYRQNETGYIYVLHSGAYNGTGKKIALGTRHGLAVRTVVAGAVASTVQVWLDGVKVNEAFTTKPGDVARSPRPTGQRNRRLGRPTL